MRESIQLVGLITLFLAFWPVEAFAHCSTYDHILVAPGWAAFAFLGVITLEIALIRRALGLPFNVVFPVMLKANAISFIVVYILALFDPIGFFMLAMPLESILSRLISGYAADRVLIGDTLYIALFSIIPYTIARFMIETPFTVNAFCVQRADLTKSKAYFTIAWVNAAALAIFLMLLCAAMPLNPPSTMYVEIDYSNIPDNPVVAEPRKDKE